MDSPPFTLFVGIVITSWTLAWSRNCPYGWLDRPNSANCYYFSKNPEVNTWEDARLKCNAMRGDLVSITNQQDWSYVNMTMRQVYASRHNQYGNWWIGLNKRDDGVTWKWADGSVADTSILPWVQNAVVTDKTKNCAHFYNFQLQVGTCSNEIYQSICSRPKGLPIQCDADNGWQHYNGRCYKYYPTARSWDDASTSCKTLGATLPIIPDLTTQTIVADFARQKKTSLWTGLRSRGQPNNIRWMWQDGSPLAGNPYWIPGQPSPNMNTHINNTCVELNTNGQLPLTWVADTCGNKRKYYCQRSEGKCADDWLEYGSMCYQFNPRYKLSWSKANSYCKGQGGDLVTITNANIQTFLNQYLATQNAVGVPELWIGLSDNNKDGGPFVFTNGVSPGTSTYQNWNSNPPKNHPGHLDCIIIVTSDPNGKWRVANSCTQVKSFICQIATNTQVKPITQPPSYYICPSNWVHSGKMCYYFNENDNTYDSARDWCQRQMADLVRITDSSVQSFLESKVQRHGDYWTGLTDRHQEGWWTWLDDTVNSTFYYWNKGEPNNFGGKENCARFLATGSPSWFGRWADGVCSLRYNFICQMAAQNAYNTPPPTTPKPWSTKCGPFWSSDPFTPYCYQFSDEKLTWFDARGTCQAHGGDLASIETSEESAYITGRIRQKQSADFWIGANDQGTEGGWKWTDGRPFAFLNWNAGEPNNFNNAEDCGAIVFKTGRWHDNYCNFRKGFICKKSAYYVCDSGWTEFKHNCFNLNHAKNTWQNSRNWCKSQNSDLARVTNLDTLGFLRGHVDGSGDWWIGLNDIHTEGTFVWLDDKQPSSVGTIQWKPGEPNADGDEDCASILMTLGHQWDGMYNDWPCSRLNNFICMKPARQVAHTPLPQTTTPKSVPAGSTYGCPLNWHGYRGSCYYFAWGTGTFDNSIAQCGYQGAKLASTIDEAENKFVFSMIPKSLSQPGKAVWIGLNDRAIEMKFTWIDGQPVSYTKWAVGEPNNWQGHDEDCVGMLTQNALWADRSCSENMPGAVCKKPKSIIPNNQLELGKGCQGAQLGYHAMCYDFHWSPTKTWSDAEKDCVNNKGHLATIPDRHVQAFLGAEMLNKPAAFWVGLSDVQKPGQYKWSSGQTLGFTAWFETHTGNERSTCVGIRSGHPAGLWENHNCTEHRSYICEYPRTGYTTMPTRPSTPPSSLPCPQSWTNFAGMCYKYFGNTTTNLKSWPGARDTCQGYGGDLVSIHNSSLETFFTSTLGISTTNSFWIGLNDRDAESGYQWTDQSPFGYSNWAPGEPNDYNNREDCVEYNPITKSWNDFYCYDTKRYICQLQKGIQLTTTQTPPVGSASPLCKGNGTWYFYNNNCYMKSPPNGTDAQKTWFDAKRYCMSQGGDLASVHSPDDNAFLTSWISNVVDSRFFWIGLNNLNMAGYQWSDGTSVQYLGWELNQPNDGLGEKRCVYLQNHRGSWSDDNCNDVLEYICQKRPLNTNPRTPPPTANVPGGCPAGFSTIPSSSRCYMLGGSSPKQRHNWTDANTWCQQQASGANLAVITNQLENKFVITLLRGVPIQAWIGLMDKQTNGRYMWVDSTEVDYTSWAPGQPNENVNNVKIQHRRDCVMMWHHGIGSMLAGGWDDYFCDHHMAYVCSVSKVTVGYVTPTPNTAGCPAGYVRYANSCYQGQKSPKTWSDAQMDCAMKNGNLVSISDAFEASFVDLIMVQQGFSWIGLADLESNGHYSWTDKYPIRFTRWAYNQPKTLDGGGCVVLKSNFKWNDTLCNNLHNYICETHVGAGPTTTPVVVGYCPDNTWTSGTDYCYKAMGSPKSWPEARYMCQRMGGNLASIGSQAEVTIITNMLTNNHTDIWIGLSKTENGGFVWTDKSPVGFLYWAHNEPSDADSTMHQDCVLMMAAGGWRWNDLDCFSRAGYICKVLQSTSTYQTQPHAGPGVTNNGQTQGPQTQGPHTNRPQTYRPQNTHNNPYHTLRPPFTNYHPSYTDKKPINTPSPLINNPGTSTGGGLSGGGIAGVIIGVLVILALFSVGLVLLKKKFNVLPRSPSSGFTNAIFDKGDEDVSVS